jgi:ubiquitin-protein ligase
LQGFRSPIVKDFDLTTEYKGLKTSAPSGVYVAPSFNNLRTWCGFIVVHQGWYKDAVFKFVMEFPDEYPDAPPRVHFLSKVYHPFVHMRTMELHLGWALKPRWSASKHSVLFVLKRLKKMFYIDDFSKYPAAWESAKKLCQVRIQNKVNDHATWCVGVDVDVVVRRRALSFQLVSRVVRVD